MTNTLTALSNAVVQAEIEYQRAATNGENSDITRALRTLVNVQTELINFLRAQGSIDYRRAVASMQSATSEAETEFKEAVENKDYAQAAVKGAYLSGLSVMWVLIRSCMEKSRL